MDFNGFCKLALAAAATVGLHGQAQGACGYGLAGPDGKLAVDAVFEDAGPGVDGFFAVRKNGLWGFADKSGEFVVKPAFDKVAGVSKEGAAVCLKGSCGHVTRDGSARLGADSSWPFENGFAARERRDGERVLYSYVNESGADVAGLFERPLKSGTYGRVHAISAAGLHEPRAPRVSPEGLLVANPPGSGQAANKGERPLEGVWSLLDGEWKTGPQDFETEPLGGGYFALGKPRTKEGGWAAKWGVWGLKTGMLTDFSWDKAGFFGGTVVLRGGGGYSLASEAGVFAEGIGRVSSVGPHLFAVDSAGVERLVVGGGLGKAGFSDRSGFSEGLMAAREGDSGLWGYVGHDGSWSLPPAFVAAGDFKDGKAAVGVAGGRTWIGTDGVQGGGVHEDVSDVAASGSKYAKDGVWMVFEDKGGVLRFDVKSKDWRLATEGGFGFALSRQGEVLLALDGGVAIACAKGLRHPQAMGDGMARLGTKGSAGVVALGRAGCSRVFDFAHGVAPGFAKGMLGDFVFPLTPDRFAQAPLAALDGHAPGVVRARAQTGESFFMDSSLRVISGPFKEARAAENGYSRVQRCVGGQGAAR